MTNIFARSLTGDEYYMSAQSSLDVELNGNQILKLSVPPNKTNLPFLDEIDSLWEIDYYGNTYKVIYAKRTTRGNSYFIDVRCVHLALDTLDSIRTYERYDGSLTSQEGFGRVFADTGYSFTMHDTFYAIDIEGLGEGETRLEMFKRLLERYKAEFYISGTTFHLQKYVGRDMSFEYRHKLNASNVQEENDGTAFYTYVRGFGDYDNGEENIVGNAGIKLTYESPLAALVGRRHAPMVAKGSYKQESTVQEEMERIVNDSLVMSVSADVKDLRLQGYPYAQPEVGDRAFLVDSRINFDEEVRVVKIVTDRFANGNIRNITVTFGNQKLGRRYASNLSSAMATLNSLMEGTIQLPFDVLDTRAKEMLKKIMSVDTELTLDNGIFAVDKANPNNVVGLNSAGWFISRDGGNTAEVIATADGIVANAITAGTLQITSNMSIVGQNGLMFWNDSMFRAVDANDSDKYTEIRPSGVTTKGSFTNIRPDAYVDNEGKKFGYQMDNGIPNADMDAQRNQFMHSGVVTWTGQRYQINNNNAYAGQLYNCETVYTTHNSKFITMGFGVDLIGDSGSDYVLVELAEFSSGNTIGTFRKFIRATEGIDWNNITLNIDVPDFSSPKSFYIRMGTEGAHNAHHLHMVVNRVRMHG